MVDPGKDWLAEFTQETNLQAEHRRLMDAHHRQVRWHESTAHEVPADLKTLLADMWRGRMVAEHRSCGIFSLYALDLLGAGAPAEVLSLACRAALDEVRHAELFARLATLYSGKPETPPPGIPPMPEDPDVPMRLQVAREALHLSVLSETYSAVSLVELHAMARDPVVQQVLGVVISDEIFHARMGWAFLSSLVADKDDALMRYLQADVVPMVVDFVDTFFGDPANLPAPKVPADCRALAEAHGYMSLVDEWALFQATIHDVWIPGLAHLGLDARHLASRYPKG